MIVADLFHPFGAFAFELFLDCNDTCYREAYDRLSGELKLLVEEGKYPRDLNNDRAFRTWRADWDCLS
ncbi:MAG: hypothetical protein V2B18_09950 [Pseudomonadota bacterium]